MRIVGGEELRKSATSPIAPSAGFAAVARVARHHTHQPDQDPGSQQTPSPPRSPASSSPRMSIGTVLRRVNSNKSPPGAPRIAKKVTESARAHTYIFSLEGQKICQFWFNLLTVSCI